MNKYVNGYELLNRIKEQLDFDNPEDCYLYNTLEHEIDLMIAETIEANLNRFKGEIS